MNNYSNPQNFTPSYREVSVYAYDLAYTFDNLKFHRWYCGVVYQFGIDQVEAWREKALKGDNPGRLFSTLVKGARNPNN
jgi:hypothetical protein